MIHTLPCPQSSGELLSHTEIGHTRRKGGGGKEEEGGQGPAGEMFNLDIVDCPNCSLNCGDENQVLATGSHIKVTVSKQPVKCQDSWTKPMIGLPLQKQMMENNQLQDESREEEQRVD